MTHLLKCAKSGALTTPNGAEDVGQQNSQTLPVGTQGDPHTWEDSLLFSTKLNILLPYNPAIALFGIYLKEVKAYAHTETCTWIVYSSIIHICANLDTTMVFLRS